MVAQSCPVWRKPDFEDAKILTAIRSGSATDANISLNYNYILYSGTPIALIPSKALDSANERKRPCHPWTVSLASTPPH
jgi:hypothetical protein